MTDLIEQALRYEQEGKLLECEQLYLKALDEHPKDKDVLCYVAIFLFKKSEYEKALDLFIQAYNHPNQSRNTKEDLLNHIITAYYQPNEEMFKKTYAENVHALLGYEHNRIPSFVEFDDLSCLCIPRNDTEFYIWDKRTEHFKELVSMDRIPTSYQVAINDCVAAVNIFDPTKLQSLGEQTRDPAWIDNIKIPVYVIWQDSEKVQQYLQLANYAPIINLKRFVFFSDYTDESQFKAFFNDHQALLPHKMTGDDQFFQQIIAILNHAGGLREQDIAQKTISIKQLASKYDRRYYKKLFTGSYDKIRILFYTSRFTTVVQYATRDFMHACETLGIQCEVVIEKSDIHRAPSNTELVHRIAEFKPNIVFFIDYFKSDFTSVPSNIMSITWVQDPIYQITSKRHAQSFGWNDFALVYTHKWYDQMIETGYDKSRLRMQIHPINEKIFCPKEILHDNQGFYSADIAFPGNYQRPEKDLADLISKHTENITDLEEKSRISHVLISTYDILQTRIANDQLIHSVEQCEALISELTVLLDVKVNSEIIKQMAKSFFHPVCYNLYRKIVLKWLIDAGFNVKLWGLGWDSDPDFKNHAFGVLTHGEELAKMYSCTKIVPGAFFEYTAHFRTWESTSCGALCIARYIPPEFDVLNVREFFTENDQFVFYHGKQDLIDKVRYYLENESERQRIAESGRQKVLQGMTYSSAANKSMQFFKDYFIAR